MLGLEGGVPRTRVELGRRKNPHPPRTLKVFPMVQSPLAVWWAWQKEQIRPPSFVPVPAGSVNGRSSFGVARLQNFLPWTNVRTLQSWLARKKKRNPYVITKYTAGQRSTVTHRQADLFDLNHHGAHQGHGSKCCRNTACIPKHPTQPSARLRWA